MKNVYLLATDKPSRLIHNDANQLCYQSNKSFKNDRKWMYRKKFNIYITNDEEIKMDDWYLDDTNSVRQAITECESYWTHRKKYQKIILTTDTDLIKDGVQVIDDEFLEWFIKNPSCEYVEVKTRYVHYYKTGETFISLSKTPEFSSRNMQCIKIEPRYEIIIPKEEPKQENCCTSLGQIKRYEDCYGCDRKPKQEKLTYTESAKKEERISNSIMMKRKQETLEEDDLKIPSKFCIPHKHYISDDDKICYETGYKDGIKWQQERMYSEEEVNDLLEMLKRSIAEITHLKYTYKDIGHCMKYLFDCETIIEQFKKK